jgi:hypothetical protein
LFLISSANANETEDKNISLNVRSIHLDPFEEFFVTGSTEGSIEPLIYRLFGVKKIGKRFIVNRRL